MANRLLAVGALEKATALGELVDMRSVRELGPVATQLRTKVIDRDKKDVRLLLRQQRAGEGEEKE